MPKTKSSHINKSLLLNVGKKLKALRIAAGYTSYENFAHDYNLDRKQYWRMENGANFTINSLAKLLKLHEISLKDFFKDFKEK